MSTSAPLPENHPLVVAWRAYTQTEEYANTSRWATQPGHTEGSLWAAFEQGWRAREDQARKEEEEEEAWR